MKRFLGLILALVVAGGFAVASQARSGGGHDGKPAGVELTYKKWFAPGFPNMVGVVGGDIVGKFGGAVLQASPDATDPNRFVQLKAVYIVIAPDPAQSFTAHVEGTQDNQTRTRGPRRPRRGREPEARPRARRVRGGDELHGGAERDVLPGHHQRQTRRRALRQVGPSGG